MDNNGVLFGPTPVTVMGEVYSEATGTINFHMVESTFTCRCGKEAQGFMVPTGWWSAMLSTTDMLGNSTGVNYIACSKPCLLEAIRD